MAEKSRKNQDSEPTSCSLSFISFMADSILTSITLAGGSFNVYYDTVLDIITKTSRGSTNCPSGWKAAILVSNRTRFTNDGNSWITLIQPIAIFNMNRSTNISYYGIYIYELAEFGTYVSYNGITINTSNFDLNTNYGNNACYCTIIFVA